MRRSVFIIFLIFNRLVVSPLHFPLKRSTSRNMTGVTRLKRNGFHNHQVVPTISRAFFRGREKGRQPKRNVVPFVFMIINLPLSEKIFYIGFIPPLVRPGRGCLVDASFANFFFFFNADTSLRTINL